MFLKLLQNSLKNIKIICDAVFNLKFLAKRSTTLLKRHYGICALLRISQNSNNTYFTECPQTSTSETSSKKENSSTR